MLGMHVPYNKDLDKSLLEATRKGDSTRVAALLQEKADPNARDNFGRTALHLAATVLNQHPPSAQHPMVLLFNKGANVTAQDNANNTPLHIAVEYDHTNAFNFLVDHGAPLDAINNHGDTALSIAEMKKNWYLFKRLVGRGADVNVARDGNTVLHRIFDEEKKFTHEEREIVLETVLNSKLPRKPDLNKRNNQGYSALHMAVLFGEYTYVRRFINAGANINIPSQQNNPTSRYHGITPLSYLVMNANDEGLDPSNEFYQSIISLLCEEGATLPPDNILEKSPQPVKDVLYHFRQARVAPPQPPPPMVVRRTSSDDLNPAIMVVLESFARPN